LRYDSVHGDFQGSVTADPENNALIINGTTVHMISANGPEDVDYTKFGIEEALVIDNTGAFTTEEALKRHLVSKGTAKVLLTAPGKGMPNIVYGVNHNEHNPENVDIFSCSIVYNQCHHTHFKSGGRYIRCSKRTLRNHTCLHKRPEFGRQHA